MPTIARIFAIALLLSLAASIARADTTEDPLAPAVAALRSGAFAKAAKLARALAENENEKLAPRAHYVAGEAQLLLGAHAEAEASFTAVLRTRPKAVPALVGLGRALAAQGKLDEAQTRLESALAIDKKDAAALRGLGELALRREEAWKDAVRTLKKARKAAPKSPEAARALVDAHLRDPKPKRGAKQALKVAKAQAKAAPKHPTGYFLQGLAYERLKKDDEAIAAYERALALDERFLDAHKNLAILCITDNPTYQDRERTAKAMKHFERYFALGGKDAALERPYRQVKAYLERSGVR